MMLRARWVANKKKKGRSSSLSKLVVYSGMQMSKQVITVYMREEGCAGTHGSPWVLRIPWRLRSTDNAGDGWVIQHA